MGYWMKASTTMGTQFICSECKGKSYCKCIAGKRVKINWCDYEYCPRCGAKMEISKDDMHVAEYYRYKMEEYRRTTKITYRKCGECKWLTGEKRSIGIGCENPEKKWRTSTAKYHYKCGKACKKFTVKETEE